MVNPLLSAGQAAATLLQQHDDEQRAYLEAVSRMHGSTVANMLSGKTLDDHKADALRDIRAERVKKQAERDEAAVLAAAEREGRQNALNAHMAKQGAKPPPATEPSSQPALTFEQARMDVYVEIDARQHFNRDLAAGAPHKSQAVYIDEAARRHLASQAQPAPAAQQPEQVPATSRRDGWPLHKPQRFQGYVVPLYHLLRASHTDGKSRPSARDVLEAWRVSPPAEVAMMLPGSFDCYDRQGDTKPVSLKALQKAIDRMTKPR